MKKERISTDRPTAPRTPEGKKMPISGKVKKGETPVEKRAEGMKEAKSSKTSMAERKVQTGKQKLNEFSKGFDELRVLAEKKSVDLDWTNRQLKYRLENIDKGLMTKEDKNKINETIDALIIAQKNMRAALFNNLRANGKALRTFLERTETLKLTEQERGILDSTFDELGKVQAKLMNVIGKDISQLTMGDLEDVQGLMKTLSGCVESYEMKNLLFRIAEEGSDVHLAFTKQIESSKEMIVIFDEAVNALKETPLNENEDLWSTLEKNLETLREADTETAKFWGAIFVASILVGIAVLVGALVLSFMIMNTPVGILLIVLLANVLPGAIFVGAGALAYGYSIDFSRENVVALKEGINFFEKVA